MLWTILLFAQFFSVHAKLPWVATSRPAETDRSVDILHEMTRQAALPSDLELDLSLSQDLDASNCFLRALPDACSSLEKVTSDLMRMQTAAAMTVCEFRQAGLGVPRECEGLSENDSQANVRACISALARSPQSYSSYSG